MAGFFAYLNGECITGRDAFPDGTPIGIQILKITFGKTFSSPPRVFVCWNDNSNVFNYMSFITVSDITTTDFKAIVKRQKEGSLWYFNWFAIAR